MARGLTDKQKAFVTEYLVDLNATQAAIRSGYSVKTAYRIGAELLQKTSVCEAIQQAQQLREKRTLVTQDYVLSGLKTVADRCLEAVPVLDSDGRETGFFKFNANGANKAFELIGRHLGMWDRPNSSADDAEVKSIHIIVEDGRKRASDDAPE